MKPDKSRIPICESACLQDVTIELGRRLRAVRYAQRIGTLEFEVKEDRSLLIPLEKFVAALYLPHSEYICVALWEDQTANYIYRKPKLNREKATYVRFWSDLRAWSAAQVAELIRDSLLDKEDIREVWQKTLPLKEE
jgi:hypothetical protein